MSTGPTCTQPGCTGTIVDGYCDQCGMAAPEGVASVKSAIPTAAVLRRLGRSGIRAGGVDLADALERAYEAFAATRPDRA